MMSKIRIFKIHSHIIHALKDRIELTLLSLYGNKTEKVKKLSILFHKPVLDMRW